MDSAMTSGATVTAVGLVAVFLALSLLVFVVTVVSRILSSSTTVAPTQSATPDEPWALPAQHELRLVAIAAYATHRARSVSVRGPLPATSWVRAGRHRQVARSERIR